ncbi:MAG TPA: hypothetical protein VJO16_15570 [Candidatus Acidoferrum sp.]|nr:hypothetical protein [Candidatus Acidoferrum sp.]
MKHLGLALGVSAALLLGGGCKKQTSDNDAIRAGILQHLNGVGTLNMSAMDMDIRSVSINGTQAHAEVVFRPRNSAPAGAGMQVAYNLEKRDGAWVVQKSQPTGGMIQHADTSKNPHQISGVHSGSLPNFSDIVNPAGSTPQGALPPGHPPVNAQAPNSSPSGTDQTPVKKPR